jgi:hypothetical protein
MGDCSNAAIMGSTHGGPPSPLQAMTGDSIEEFHMDSDGEARIDHPTPRRHGTGTLAAQAMMTILPQQAVLWHEPPLREERILMMDYAHVQAWGKGEALPTSHEGSLAMAATTKALSASPPPTINGVDRLYHQLVEIHAIATAQLA